MNIVKSTDLVIDFLTKQGIWDFLNSDPNIYIGGSLPFITLSNKINSIEDINIGDIDIYTKNCPLLFRNINKKFKISNIIKTGVNVKFNICSYSSSDYVYDSDSDEDILNNKISSNLIPIQIVTSRFEDFESEVLDEYDCGMVSVGFHPATSSYIIHKKFYTQLENSCFEVFMKDQILQE